MTDGVAAPLHGARATQAWSRFWLRWRRFDGRASRSEVLWMWMWLVLMSMPILALAGVGVVLQRQDDPAWVPLNAVASLALVLLAAVTAVPWVALLVRRARDVGLPPWAVLGLLVPLVQIGVALLLALGASDAVRGSTGRPPTREPGAMRDESTTSG